MFYGCLKINSNAEKEHHKKDSLNLTQKNKGTLLKETGLE